MKTFDKFFDALIKKSLWFPPEELATMTAGEVARKRKHKDTYEKSKLRNDALRQAIFIGGISAVENKTFDQLAKDYQNYFPCGIPKGMISSGESRTYC